MAFKNYFKKKKKAREFGYGLLPIVKIQARWKMKVLGNML